MSSAGGIVNWQIIALTSGTFAALNGVFAKLTTDTTTSSWIDPLTKLLHIPAEHSHLLEYAIRLTIFVLSFAMGSTMWALYTRALAAAPSAVQANVINTSSNFIVAALLGALLFGEQLPGTWWIGAALLIAGTVVIGTRTETEQDKDKKKK